MSLLKDFYTLTEKGLDLIPVVLNTSFGARSTIRSRTWGRQGVPFSTKPKPDADGQKG